MSDRYEISALVQSGLSESEAKLLSAWCEKGKPGIAKYHPEQYGAAFVAGYSCEDLAKWTDVPVEVLLYGRVYYAWDELRKLYRDAVINDTLESALAAKFDSLKLVTEMIQATHIKWKKELAEYQANPKGKEPPAFLPSTISGYKKLIELMKSITDMISPKQPGSTNPIVNVNVGQGAEVKVVTPSDAKKALLEGIQARNK